MSFTERVKNEISLLELTKSEEIAELSALVRANAKFFDNYAEIYTENVKVAKRVFSLIKNIYNVNCEVITKKSQVFDKKNIYYIRIEEKKDIILKDLSVVDNENKFIEMIEEYIIGSLDEIKAYIRGAFLAKGSINDPKTSQYHLEFLFD